MGTRGKVAIVTGAAVGTGRAIGQRLAAEGASVALTDVDASQGHQTLSSIRAAGGKATFFQADITRDAELEEVVRLTADTFGGIDILVNNAGGGGHIPPHFPEAGPAQWGAVIDLNLRAPLRATQLVLTHMRRRGRGAVVNIGSTAGLGLDDYQSPEYGAAKAGLIRATASLAHLAQTDSVRINCVVPDWVATDRATAELATLTDRERARMPPLVPLSQLCDEVITLIEDETAAGQIVVLRRGRAAYTLTQSAE